MRSVRRLLALFIVTCGLIGSTSALSARCYDDPNLFCGAICIQYQCWFDSTQPHALWNEFPGGCGSIPDSECCHQNGAF